MASDNSVEKNPRKRRYRVVVGDIYTVYQNSIKSSKYYKIMIKKHFPGDKYEYYYKTIKFKDDITVPDRTKIKILNFYEDVMKNKKDPYNPYWYLVITNFEIVDENLNKKIFNDVQKKNNNIKDVDLENEYKDIDDIELFDDDLPF